MSNLNRLQKLMLEHKATCSVMPLSDVKALLVEVLRLTVPAMIISFGIGCATYVSACHLTAGLCKIADRAFEVLPLRIKAQYAGMETRMSLLRRRIRTRFLNAADMGVPPCLCPSVSCILPDVMHCGAQPCCACGPKMVLLAQCNGLAVFTL